MNAPDNIVDYGLHVCIQADGLILMTTDLDLQQQATDELMSQ